MKFKFMILGKNMARSENGNGFSGEGYWDLYKCFIDNGNGYGEFYINFNNKTGDGEIVQKSPDYAHFLRGKFTRLFTTEEEIDKGIENDVNKEVEENAKDEDDEYTYPLEDAPVIPELNDEEDEK